MAIIWDYICFSIHECCFLWISAFEEMLFLFVFISDSYSETMKEMGYLHYFLTRSDFDAQFSFGGWKLIFQLRFLDDLITDLGISSKMHMWCWEYSQILHYWMLWKNITRHLTGQGQIHFRNGVCLCLRDFKKLGNVYR